MKKIIFLYIVILLILGACSSASTKENTSQNKKAVYSATIYDANLRINKIKWVSGEKLNLQEGKYELESFDNIFDQNGDKIKVEDLVVGDKIKVYFSPQVVVKETDPGQISAEYIRKIVKSE
ncbi:hypothetical protein HCJ66_01570 [Listeria sp. FSL L7-1582]|uniref:membrane lipoprotein lipid attachment site-containing protein n=1 Tax=Listeria portnoyi TaxID=2713504 RepID=UPI00164E3802|nr:membrane lipoprotein lipid attachment site-containing protein [Listeria portnoyi]MBC6308232.1 hypothetical protein [Listeria portnoyi]